MALSLVFDGNYLFYKTLFIFGGYGSKGKRILEDTKEQEMFIRKIATDMAHAIRTFGNPERIVFTIDSRSWRKDIEIEDGAYKGNREKDETVIDWDSFYRCMNEFGDILRKKGIIVSKEERAEGDDLMYLWADRFYKAGEDCVIITGDKDLTQCIKLNNNNFIIVFNPNSKNRKIVAPEGFKKWVKTEGYDLFDASTFMNRSKDLIAEVLAAVPVEEIDPAYTIFEKVIVGDAGDAVPPIWTWKNKEKTHRVTPAKVQRIYEIINMTKFVDDVYNLPERATEIANGILATCKQVAPAEVIKSRLARNLQLVYLDHRTIPADIQEKFTEAFEKYSSQKLSAANYDLVHLLEGTRFISSGRTFDADIFKALDF
jgi:5'-3' exonuclease